MRAMEHQPKHKIFPTLPETTSGLSFIPIDIPQNEESDLQNAVVQVARTSGDKKGEDGVGRYDSKFIAMKK